MAPETDVFHIALEPGARGRFLGMLVAIVPAAFSVGGFELITMLVASSILVYNSTHFPLNQVFSRGGPTPHECH